MTGPNRDRKESSVEGVVYDIQRIFQIIDIKDDIGILFDDNQEGLLKFITQHENKGTLPGSINFSI